MGTRNQIGGTKDIWEEINLIVGIKDMSGMKEMERVKTWAEEKKSMKRNTKVVLSQVRIT